MDILKKETIMTDDEKTPFFMEGGLLDELMNTENKLNQDGEAVSRGGELKLINQGTYGCIFHPGINCQGKKESIKYLTKIMKNAKTIENEIYISNFIKQIKGYTRFFAPIIKQCPVKISSKYVGEVKQCKLFGDLEDTQIKKQTYVSNKIRYVGSTNISSHIMEQNTPISFWRELLETHTYLLKGAIKLQSQDIIHHDVKFNNIMYDKTLNKPVFIDFGISIHVPSLRPSNLHNAFYVFDTYPYWCFEVCICNYIFRKITYNKALTTKITEMDLETVFTTFVYGYERTYSKDGSPQIQNDIFQNFVFPMDPPVIIENYKNIITKYYTQFIGQTWYSLFDHFIQNKIYYTWDTYSLAVVYLFILDDYMKKQKETFLYIQQYHKNIYNMYVKMLYDILLSTPSSRPSPQQTIQSLKKISIALSNLL